MRTVENLVKYMITEGVDSPLRIQKILFFMRYEEIKNNEKENSFFKSNNNFQAWIYGPVNKESYEFAKTYFSNETEKEEFLLTDDEIRKVIKDKYGKYFEKYKKYTAKRLIDLSHKNKAWKIARKGIPIDEPCQNFMKEDENFLKLEND